MKGDVIGEFSRSTRFVKYGDMLWTLNLWVVTDAGRTDYAVHS
jgi:hypothetical protein